MSQSSIPSFYVLPPSLSHLAKKHKFSGASGCINLETLSLKDCDSLVASAVVRGRFGPATLSLVTRCLAAAGTTCASVACPSGPEGCLLKA